MAYPQHEKIPGGGVQEQHRHYGQFEEGIEPVVHQYGQYPEHYNPEPAAAAAASFEPPRVAQTTDASRILGMKKRLFWILISILILLLVLVIGLGIGLGVKLNQVHSPTSAAQSTVTSTPTSDSSSAQPTATYTAATSTGTPTDPCPAQNLTLYTATTAVKAQFRLYCGFDFSGNEAADLASVNTVSMEACMDACASADGCQGAGWGSTGGSATSTYTCYLKTNLTAAHDANDDSWCFALNLNTTGSVTI